MPTSKVPTYSPTPGNETMPTYSPTPVPGNGTIPTYSPTPGWTMPTYSPTGAGKNGTSAVPTYAPSPGSAGDVPTYSPTGATIPTYSPTGSTTYAPTEGGTAEPWDLVVWGRVDSTSLGSCGCEEGNMLVPRNRPERAVDASAGTEYQLFVDPVGVAYAAGTIDDLDYYRGHLGARLQDLTAGYNYAEVTRAFDATAGGVAFPPRFVRAFAGARDELDPRGGMHSALLDGRGNVWLFGSNSNGQLCLGDDVDRLVPERLAAVTGVVDVAIGARHTLLLTGDGTVYACGDNSSGQLGLGKTLPGTNVPIEVYLLTSPASSVSAGAEHSLILGEDGIYVFGSNGRGQLCVDTGGEDVYVPRSIEIDPRVAEAFEATSASSYILYTDGSVNSCGGNGHGQLGDGTTEDKFLTTVMTDGAVVRLMGVGPASESVFLVGKDDVTYGELVLAVFLSML